MNKKRIWIVTELFHPEETAVAYIFTRIANQLSNDYNVNVISGPAFYDNEKINFSDQEQLSDNIKIYRAHSPNLNKNSLVQRTVKILLLSLRMGNLLKQKVAKGEIVILATNPALLLLIIRCIKFTKKIQLHILVHDVFPENTIPARIFKSNKSILYRTLKFIFDRAYAKADHLIVLGRDMKNVMIKKTSKYNHSLPISIVTNWTNPKKIYPIKKNESNSELESDENKIVLQYSGNIGRVQRIEELLECFRSCDNNNLHLKIQGTGALRNYIKSFIKEHNSLNISLNEGFSRLQENDVLNDCDIAIVSLSPGMYGLGVPSKTYNILAAGKPILFFGDELSEVYLTVKENNIGWCFTRKEELVIFLNKLTKDSVLLEEMGNRALELAKERYDENIVLSNFQKKIEEYSKAE